MDFVIPIAGKGTRLGKITREIPKCLVEVNGKSILERLLEQAEDTREFERIILIVGYQNEKVISFIKSIGENFSLPIMIVYNERFSETNNAYSLWCARNEIKDKLVLCDGDLVMDSAILKYIASKINKGKTGCIAVDTGSNLDEEAMKFILDSRGNISKLSKNLNPLFASGESIGLYGFSKTDTDNIMNYLEEIIKSGQENEYYEIALQKYLDDGWKPSFVDVRNLSWVEVDDPNDLNRARKTFAPELVGGGGNSNV